MKQLAQLNLESKVSTFHVKGKLIFNILLTQIVTYFENIELEVLHKMRSWRMNCGQC